MKQTFERATLPTVDWDSYNEYYKIETLGWWWTCPMCGVTHTCRVTCRGCGRKRELLREGYGPRGGELYGWYMRSD